MDRSFFTFLGCSLLGISTLGFLWPFSGPIPTPPKSEGWRLLEPISYENLTIFPVANSAEHDTSAFLTLEDGLSSGEVTVREQGAETMVRDRNSMHSNPPGNYGGPSVNQLVLINHSKRPLLLLAGELVSGGKQDRIIAKDRLVAPGSDPLPLNVFCVEHGRWSAGSQFNAAKTIVHPSVREQAAVKQNQSEVWASVTAGTTASRTASGGAANGSAVATPAARVSADAIAQTMRSEAEAKWRGAIFSLRANFSTRTGVNCCAAMRWKR